MTEDEQGDGQLHDDASCPGVGRAPVPGPTGRPMCPVCRRVGRRIGLPRVVDRYTRVQDHPPGA